MKEHLDLIYTQVWEFVYIICNNSSMLFVALKKQKLFMELVLRHSQSIMLFFKTILVVVWWCLIEIKRLLNIFSSVIIFWIWRLDALMKGLLLYNKTSIKTEKLTLNSYLSSEQCGRRICRNLHQSYLRSKLELKRKNDDDKLYITINNIEIN